MIKPLLLTGNLQAPTVIRNIFESLQISNENVNCNEKKFIDTRVIEISISLNFVTNQKANVLHCTEQTVKFRRFGVL